MKTCHVNDTARNAIELLGITYFGSKAKLEIAWHVLYRIEIIGADERT